jgi:cell division protein FtsZ
MDEAQDMVALDLSEEDAIDGDADELLLDSDDILTSPVGSPPIAPPEEDSIADADDSPKPQMSSGGTLFERMQNIARGAAKAQVEDEDSIPSYRSEPLDIPRFLNRQNNH